MFKEVLAHANGIIVDLGAGRVRFAKSLLENPKVREVVAIEIDFNKLHEAKNQYREQKLHLVCGSITYLPLRESSIDTAISILVLHELAGGKEEVEKVVKEAKRILKAGGKLIIVDKYLYKPKDPAEALSLIIEDLYHEALREVKGIKVWGLQKPEEYLNIVKKYFNKVTWRKMERGKKIPGEVFIKEYGWGKETKSLVKMIEDENTRIILENKIKEVEETALKYGYKSSKVLEIIAEK